MAEYEDLDVVDDNNTARFPEGMPPSAVNDGARADEGMTARWYRDTSGHLSSTGTANVYEITPNRTVTALYRGFEVTWVANFTNTGATQIKIGTLTAVNLLTTGLVNLAGGEIIANGVATAIYDGTQFQLTNMDAKGGSPITTEGDLVVGDGTGQPSRLPVGSANQGLSVKGATVTYTGGTSAKSANYTVIESDHEKTILVDATAAARTISFDPAADLGDNFSVTVKIEAGDNDVTLDPNLSETIDGQTTKVIKGENTCVTVTCDGTSLYVTQGPGAGSINALDAQTASASANLDFPINEPNAKEIVVRWRDIDLSGNDDILVQIGTGGTPQTTGYASNWGLLIGSGSNGSSTSGFIVRQTSPTSKNTGRMTIGRLDGNEWVADHNTRRDANGTGFGAGDVTLTGICDILRVTASGSNNIDSGKVSVQVKT